MAALLFVSVASAAGADITYSPPVRSSQGDNLGCFVQNLSDGPVEVLSDLNNGLGTIVDSETLTVPAGQTLQLARTSTAVFGAFCRFSFDASAQQVRGFISLQDAGGSNTRLLFAATPNSRVLGGTATTYSPPVRSSQGDNLGCKVLNLTDGPVEVVSELQNGLNTVVDSQTLTIPGGQALLLARSNSAIFGGYCRFDFEGNPLNIRGYITLEDAGGSNTRLLYEASTALAPSPVDTPTATAPPPEATTTPTPPAGCCGDCDANGTVAINELIIAVNNGLNGCP